MKKSKVDNKQFNINENNSEDLVKKLKSSFNTQKEFLQFFEKNLSEFFEKLKKNNNIKLDDVPLFNTILKVLPDIIIQLGLSFSYIFYIRLCVEKLLDLYYDFTEEKFVKIFEAWSNQIDFIEFDDKLTGLINSLIAFNIIKKKDQTNKELNSEQNLFLDIIKITNKINECKNNKIYNDDDSLETQYNNILKEMKILSFDKNNYPAQIEYYQENLNSIKEDLDEIIKNKNKTIKKPKINNDININVNIKKPKNNNDIIINVNKEKEDITNIPLDKRTSFILNEKIKEKVNQEIEFKNCSFPLSTNDSGEIKKILCSFLNAEGGRLYLGINKKNEVKGMTLNYKKRDTLRNDLINLVYDFYPKCRVDKIYVYFLPIKDNKNNFIPKIYVIKIRVYPGDKAFLYSMTKLGYLSYIRRKEECYELQPQEIYDEIIRRDELKYKKDNENNIIIKEKDPEPEVNQQDLENVDDEIPIFVNENKPAKKSNTKQKKKNKIIVKISNIDKDVEINDINRFFNNCNCSSRKILKGHGYLYFSNKNDAEECITKYDGKQIGNKFIKLNIINNEE